MVGDVLLLVSARVWKDLSPEERETITRLMARHLDGAIDTYISKEADWLLAVEGTGTNIVEADASFFQDAIAQWEAIWSEKAPALATLRKVADETRQ